MSEDTINILRSLAFQYCNEPRNTYIGGQTQVNYELNRNNFEKLSGFVNWIEKTNKTADSLTDQKEKK